MSCRFWNGDLSGLGLCTDPNRATGIMALYPHKATPPETWNYFSCQHHEPSVASFLAEIDADPKVSEWLARTAGGGK